MPLATSQVRVWKRWSHDSLLRVSSVVHVLPSLEPWSCQSLGSRSGASLAEARAYLLTTTGLGKVRVSQPLGWKASHLLLTSPSTPLAAVSSGGLSALALTAVACAVMSPGIPVAAGPVTPAALGLPSAPVSTVLVQSTGRCPSSKELANDPPGPVGAACPAWTAGSWPSIASAMASATDTGPRLGVRQRR